MGRHTRPGSVLAVVLLCAAFIACRGASSARSAEDGAGSGSRDDELEPMLPPLQKEDVTVGAGPEAREGDTVVVHYVGMLDDGTVFDSSRERGTPLEFTLGSGTVIAGWELGVAGMKAGGRRKLTIPPHLAYGRRGSPPKIPPDATLSFDVELLELR